MAKEHMRGGKRRVTAQIDLHLRREPAQRYDITARDDEGGFREIVLGGDRRQHPVRQPLVEQDHRSRISAEHAIGEGVDLV